MEEIYLVISGLVLLACVVSGYSRTGDPLAPIVLFFPMLFYIYVWHPGILLYQGQLETVFGNRPLGLVFLVHAIGLSVFSATLVAAAGDQRVRNTGRQSWFFKEGTSDQTRRYLRQLAIFAGIVSAIVMWSMILSSGGLEKLLSERKPYLQSPVSSGYYRELTKLGYLAILLLATSVQGQKVTFQRFVLLLLLGQAPLLEATVAGRRGPMALSILTLGAAWFIMRSKRPNLRLTLTGVLVVGAMCVLLAENRNRLFQPLEYEIRWDGIAERVLGTSEVASGDEFVSAAANIVRANETSQYYWGMRIFSLVFVRPIPSSLWPGKYESLGLGWMERGAGKHGLSSSEWMEITGVDVQTGTSTGFIADLFMEFSWGYVLVCLFLGHLFGSVYRRFVAYGGGYTLAYLLISILSLYLFAQSLGAWLEKLLMLGIPMWFIWRGIRKVQSSGYLRMKQVPRRPVSPMSR